MANVQYIALSVFNPVFCSRTATVKVSLFSFIKQKTKRTQTKTKPVLHVLQYHECE